MALGREAEAVDSVRPAVGPLAEFVRRLGERHVGGDGAVDDGLCRANTHTHRDALESCIKKIKCG